VIEWGAGGWVGGVGGQVRWSLWPDSCEYVFLLHRELTVLSKLRFDPHRKWLEMAIATEIALV